MIRHPKNRPEWNRKNTYNILVAFDKILDSLDMSQVDFNILMPQLINGFKIRDNNFNCLYIEDYSLNNIAKYTTIEKYDNIGKYIRKRKTKPLRTRKILGLTYKHFLEDGFMEIKDISLENIILRQIHEITGNVFIKNKGKIRGDLKTFIIPKKFIKNEFEYEIV